MFKNLKAFDVVFPLNFLDKTCGEQPCTGGIREVRSCFPSDPSSASTAVSHLKAIMSPPPFKLHNAHH